MDPNSHTPEELLTAEELLNAIWSKMRVSSPPRVARRKCEKHKNTMNITPEDVTAWLKATVPYLPAILPSLALVIIAFRLPVEALSMAGLAAGFKAFWHTTH